MVTRSIAKKMAKKDAETAQNGWTVTGILDKRVRNRRAQYLVEWENTWEEGSTVVSTACHLLADLIKPACYNRRIFGLSRNMRQSRCEDCTRRSKLLPPNPFFSYRHPSHPLGLFPQPARHPLSPPCPSAATIRRMTVSC